MSSFRSVNTRQSQAQMYNVHKRPTFRGPSVQPQHKKTSVASSSVYDPDEAPRNTRLTIKQAITLITLRLGRLEVFANETKSAGGIRTDSEGAVDKDFLLSLVTRIENMEKMFHNLRIECEKNRQLLHTINESMEDVEGIENDPIILEIMEKLNTLTEIANPEVENEPPVEPEPENEPPVEPEITEAPETPDIHITYNPDVIEPYTTYTAPNTAPNTAPVEPEIETPVEVQKSKRRVKKNKVI